MFGKLFIALLATSFVAAAPVDNAVLEKRMTHSGRATYFATGQGACGWWNNDDDKIVALNTPQYLHGGANGDGGGNCGQWLTITNTQNGNVQEAQVADECPTCDWGSLDMSPSLFAALNHGNMDEGEFPISWHFNKR